MARPVAYSDTHIIDMIQMQTKMKRAVIRNVLKSYHDLIPIVLEEIGTIRIYGFGTYKVVEQKPRNGTHPITLEPIVWPGKKVVKFTYDKGGKHNKYNRGSQLKKK